MVMCEVMGVKTNIFLLIDLRDFFVKFWGEGGGDKNKLEGKFGTVK